MHSLGLHIISEFIKHNKNHRNKSLPKILKLFLDQIIFRQIDSEMFGNVNNQYIDY